MTAPVQKTPFLITSRDFPTEDPEQLKGVLTKMYFDISTAMNNREISIYDTFQSNTGQHWFANGQLTSRLQAFRQVYKLSSITNGTNTIATGITIDANTQFVEIYGTAESSTNSVPLTPWINGALADAPYLRVNRSTANIEIIATTGNWTGYSAKVVVTYILNN